MKKWPINKVLPCKETYYVVRMNGTKRAFLDKITVNVLWMQVKTDLKKLSQQLGVIYSMYSLPIFFFSLLEINHNCMLVTTVIETEKYYVF